MTRARVAAAVAIVVAVVVAGGSGAARARPARIAATAPAHGIVDKHGRPAGPLAPGEVRVVDPGRLPRTTLRYRVPVGARLRQAMTMKIALDAGTLPIPAMPPMTFALDLECVAVEPDGAMRFEARFVSFTAEGSGPMASAVKQVAAMMKDLVYRFRLTPRGDVDDVVVEGMTGPMAALGEQMKDQFEQFSIPLPSTAVGQDAVWLAKRVGRANNVTMTLAYRYHLRELRGALVSFDITGDVSAPRQTVTQNGTSFLLEHLAGKAAGSLALDLSRYAPVGAVSVTMHMLMSSLGANIELRMTMDTSMTAR